MKPTETRFGARTDVGKVREKNEDNFLVDPSLGLHIVADGMGGHAGGAVASATAVNVVRDGLASHRSRITAYEPGGADVTRHELLSLIERNIQLACFRIYERGVQNPAVRGMGTTLSLVIISGERAFIGHVGDSRVYLIREGLIHQLTDDHSLLSDMLRHGRVRAAADVSPRFRSAITRAVGVQETVEVDTLDLAILPGDRLLICSDGLHGYAEAETLRDIVSAHSSQDAACEALIAHANALGGADNITAIVIEVTDMDAAVVRPMQQLLATVRRLQMFKYLSYSELLRVIDIAEERHVPMGATIFQRGDVERAAYIIVEGRVQVRTSNVIIAVLESGQHFGEMALVDDEPRSADALAMGETRLLVVPRGAFYELMRKNPMLAVKLLWSFLKAITVRLRRTTGELSLVKTLFHSVKPEEVEKLPTAWLSDGDLLDAGPKRPRDDGPPPVPSAEDRDP